MKTFRCQNGLWENHAVEDVASIDGFRRDPELVYRFYNERRRQLIHGGVAPNAAHESLARFEESFNGDFILVTQNVDNLHQRAGSKNIFPMHGNLLQAKFEASDRIVDWEHDLDGNSHKEHFPEVNEGRLRPNIVWFGEMPYFLDQIYESLQRADLFVAIGTSGLVYPAAGFLDAAPPTCVTIEMNLEQTAASSRFESNLFGKASDICPEFFAPM